MSGYYWNKLNNTNFSRAYDRDYAVIKKIEKGRITIEIAYNSVIKMSDVIVKRDLTADEATDLLNTFR